MFFQSIRSEENKYLHSLVTKEGSVFCSMKRRVYLGALHKLDN